MSRLKQLWAKILRIAEALEGVDHPIGSYMFALEKRVDKLERELEQLESQLRSRPGSGRIQQ